MKKIHPWLPPVIAVLWLGGLELACDQHSETVLWLGFVALSIALVIETWKLWTRGGTKAQKLTLVAVGAVVVALLDTAVYNIARADHSLITNDEEAVRLPIGGSAEAVCPGCKVLWKGNDQWLLGQPRTDWLTCAYDIDASNIISIVPADFEAYAHLVDPRFKGHQHGADNVFLTWQYPRQRFAIVEFSPDATRPRSVQVRLALEDNRAGKRGIYAVEPFFRSDHYDWHNRLRSYANLFRAIAGKSPHCRNDLQDDPYFLILRGDRARAQQSLASLPADRRDFLQRKLDAPPPPPKAPAADEPDEP
jgi:hypothetical protein